MVHQTMHHTEPSMSLHDQPLLWHCVCQTAQTSWEPSTLCTLSSPTQSLGPAKANKATTACRLEPPMLNEHSKRRRLCKNQNAATAQHRSALSHYHTCLLHLVTLCRARDVASIDINMGCPKHFSLQAGMGAALLKTPEVAVDVRPQQPSTIWEQTAAHTALARPNRS